MKDIWEEIKQVHWIDAIIAVGVMYLVCKVASTCLVLLGVD